uniref:Cilia- and flagella-associated protein 43 n=1 Tax=Panagrellus redivivus TaxID=6233 RepID=A0A7E4VU02_PANRE
MVAVDALGASGKEWIQKAFSVQRKEWIQKEFSRASVETPYPFLLRSHDQNRKREKTFVEHVSFNRNDQVISVVTQNSAAARILYFDACVFAPSYAHIPVHLSMYTFDRPAPKYVSVCWSSDDDYLHLLSTDAKAYVFSVDSSGLTPSLLGTVTITPKVTALSMANNRILIGTETGEVNCYENYEFSVTSMVKLESPTSVPPNAMVCGLMSLKKSTVLVVYYHRKSMALWLGLVDLLANTWGSIHRVNSVKSPMHRALCSINTIEKSDMNINVTKEKQEAILDLHCSMTSTNKTSKTSDFNPHIFIKTSEGKLCVYEVQLPVKAMPITTRPLNCIISNGISFEKVPFPELSTNVHVIELIREKEKLKAELAVATKEKKEAENKLLELRTILSTRHAIENFEAKTGGLTTDRFTYWQTTMYIRADVQAALQQVFIPPKTVPKATLFGRTVAAIFKDLCANIHGFTVNGAIIIEKGYFSTFKTDVLKTICIASQMPCIEQTKRCDNQYDVESSNEEGDVLRIVQYTLM